LKISARWRAQIYLKRGRKHLGYFVSAVEAARAYDAAMRKYRGEFVVTNFD